MKNDIERESIICSPECMNCPFKTNFENNNKLTSKGIIAVSNRAKIEMVENNISIIELSRLTNINSDIIESWFYGNDLYKEIDLNNLAMICYILYQKNSDFLK